MRGRRDFLWDVRDVQDRMRGRRQRDSASLETHCRRYWVLRHALRACKILLREK